MRRLKVALMGLADTGADYLTAIRSDDQFELVAVADTNPEVLRRHAGTDGLRSYEDYRSLIVETAHTGLDLLFVALEPFQSVEFVQMAADRGIGVFHKAPFARNLREAQRLVQLFQRQGCPIVVPRDWQFEPMLTRHGGLSILAGHVYGAAVGVRTTDTPIGWRGDSARAGGGVLLNGAYGPLDMLIHLMGPPETVYGRCTMAGTPGTPRKYDTEDVAIVSLDFGHQQVGCLTACRGTSKSSWNMTLMGTERTVDLCSDRMTVTPDDGTDAQYQWVRTPQTISSAVSAFGRAVLWEPQSIDSTGQTHLSTMAVIEAAYLSAKTGAPESPDRITG